ncbi:MAG: M23 family metallopeptidase [Chloroflexia bacterium]
MSGAVTRKEGPNHGYGDIDFDIQGGPVSGSVYASKPGTVVFVKESSNSGACDISYVGRANVVVVQHGGSEFTWYYHLAYNSVPVAVGNSIGFGTKIGVEGATGAACGVHLHITGSSGHTGWTDPRNPNVAPGPTGTAPVDFAESSYARLTPGVWYTSQNSRPAPTYAAAFASQSSHLTLMPGESGQMWFCFRNTGTAD